MRNILGGLLGGKHGARQILKDLLNDLTGQGVTSDTWDRCCTCDILEDVIDEDLPRERVVAIVVSHPKNVYGLALLCINTIEATLQLEGESFDEPAETSLANSMTVLSHLLSAGPAGGAAGTGAAQVPAQQPLRPPHPLTGLLWEPCSPDASGQEVRPLAERILDATMRLMFFDGFTIDLKDSDEAPEKSSKGTVVDGVDADLLWSQQVGPESEFAQEAADDDVRENRTLALQLLLAMLCGAAPATALKELAELEAKAELAKPKQQRGRATEREKSNSDKAASMEAAAAASSAVCCPLITDKRALAYLQSPERSVPFRGELLYSLISIALDYDPHGYGIPLGGLFRESKDESFVSLCFQVLGLLLQDTSEVDLPIEAAIVARCPQELLHQQSAPLPSPGAHIFRQLLACACKSDREVQFIFGGIVQLLGIISEEQRSYLPGSVRVPPFLPELMVLIFHLAAVDGFVKGFCRNENCGAPSMADVLVAFSLQAAPEHLQEDVVPAIAMAALLRFTAYRDFCDQLNEDYDGDSPDELPEFKGNFADVVALTALKQAADKVAMAQVSMVSWVVVEVSLCTLDNISTFAEGLCMESCFRLFALLERCGKPAMVKRGRSGLAIWLPRLLEALQNAVQYQYAPNVDMVYGLMTRQAMLKELDALVAKASERTQLEESTPTTEHQVNGENGHSSPAEPSTGAGATAEAASPSDVELPEMAPQWWDAVKASLVPISMLLREVTPHVEAEVERREISSPEEAKKCLPRTALGLLPVPHAFTLRSVRDNVLTHHLCEHCLVNSVANGPVGTLWEDGGDLKDDDDRGQKEPKNDEKPGKPKPKQGSSERKRSTSRRTRSVERTRGRDTSDRAKGPKSSPERAPPSPPAPPADPAAALQAQLAAAAAAGIDVQALLQQLTQAPAAAAPPPPATAATPEGKVNADSGGPVDAKGGDGVEAGI